MYPTVSYTKDTDKVWYKERSILNRIIATYSVTEDEVGFNVLLASNFENCSDIILDGKSLNVPISVNSFVTTPTSYGIYSDMTFTDDSWVVSPAQPWEITFDKPLQAGDMIGLSLFIPQFNAGESAFMPYEEVVSLGFLTPIEPNNTQKFTSYYTTEAVGADFNILMCAFTLIDEDSTVTEDNFIGATHEIKSGGFPTSVVVKPTEATTYIVEYIFPKGYATKTVIKNISDRATSVDLSSFDTSNVTDMSEMFRSCHSLTSITFSKNFGSACTDMSGMFYDCGGLTSLDLSLFNTSKVTTMNGMFHNCNSLTSLDLSSFDMSNVADMYRMFYQCSSLTSITFGYTFDVTNVTDMGHMFYNCTSLTSLDLGNFDASGVTNINYMFYKCDNLTSVKYFKKIPPTFIKMPNSVKSLDLSSWDASNFTSMSNLFYYCSSLTSITFGDNFNTSNVTDMSGMFGACGVSSLDLSNFDTSKVTDMSRMFDGC